MEQIIQRKTKAFDPGKFVDHYQTALRELIDEKLEGKVPAKTPEHRPAQVIDLMEALKRSLAEERKSPAATPRRAATRPAAGGNLAGLPRAARQEPSRQAQIRRAERPAQPPAAGRRRPRQSPAQ